MNSEEIAETMIISPDVYVAETGTGKGRAVFAARDYQADEVVEVCPVTIYPHGYGDSQGDLSERLFTWPDQFGRAKLCALPWGCGVMYNHGNPANLRYSVDAKEKTITFRAGTAIQKHEEMTINFSARDRSSQAGDDR